MINSINDIKSFAKYYQDIIEKNHPQRVKLSAVGDLFYITDATMVLINKLNELLKEDNNNDSKQELIDGIISLGELAMLIGVGSVVKE